MTAEPSSTQRRQTLVFAGTVVAMLALFRVLDVAIARLATLPAAAYHESFFLDNLFARWTRLATTRIPWWLTVACIVLAALALLADARRFSGAGRRRLLSPLFAGWHEVEEGTALRWLVVGITAIPAWALSCYARNLYFDQLHLADRLIVVALWLAIAWRPLFVLPFALAAGAVAGQFTVPLGFISWTEMGVLLRFPVLVAAFWIVRAVTGSRTSGTFIFAWCCLIATTYWMSGLGKLRIDWLTHPHIAYLLLGAHANGWLAWVSTDSVTEVARHVTRFAFPLMLFTLAVECGALVLLWRRWSLVGFLMLAAAFHLGAFALSGILFWKWMLADAVLLIYLLRKQRLQRLRLFTPGRFALSVALVLASPLWVNAEDLTWFDTPLTYSLRFEGVSDRGRTYPLPAGFFRPYTEAIVLGTFPSVSPHAQLTRGMGVTQDRALADSLEAARTPAEVFTMEAALGGPRVDSVARAAFDDFVARHAANARCSALREPLLLRVVGVPRHLWTSPANASLPCDVRIDWVRVSELTTFHDGDSLRVIRQLLVREIDVAPARTRSAQP